MKKIIRLRTDGTTEILNAPNDMDSQYLASLIDCDWIEIVRPKEGAYVLVVDEEGLLKEDVKWNPYASYLYGFISHGTPIAGDALLMCEVFGKEGPELAGIPEQEATEIIKIFDSTLYNIMLQIIEKLIRELKEEK